jgi:hypothetical protein
LACRLVAGAPSFSLKIAMKIAFLTDPLSQFKTYKDSTFAMMREAVRRGYTVYAFGPADMALEGGKVIASISKITLTGDSEDWYRAEAPQALPLSALMRYCSVKTRRLIWNISTRPICWSWQNSRAHASSTNRQRYAITMKN